MLSSESQSWRTPAVVLDGVVYPILGCPLTVDPCHGDEDPPSLVQAVVKYTRRENGLIQPWGGLRADGEKSTFFANSEYGIDLGMWTARARLMAARREFGGIRCCTGIGLWPSRTDTEWYHRDIMSADAILHWAGRLVFEGAPAGAPFPSVLPYWGDDVEAFIRVGTKYGSVTVPRGPLAGVYPYKGTTFVGMISKL